MRRHRRRLGAALVVVGAAVASRLTRYLVADDSMAPALQDGDWVIALRRPRRLRPGDVVVVEHPRRPGFELVKRVTAVEDDGVDGPVLEPGELWILGDNPSAGSIDSRSFGPVPSHLVRARVLARYGPLGRIGPIARS